MRGSHGHSPLLGAAVCAATLALAGACGGGDGSDGGGPGGDPITGADGAEVAQATDTSRIIPLNGDIAEVVFALGLGDAVVGTDVSATYPPEADALPEVGYQRTLLAEAILSLDPTVVVGNTGAGPPEVLDQLRGVGVPVVIIDYPHDLTGPAAKIRLVARVLDVPARGEALAREVEAAIEDASELAERRIEAGGGERLRTAFLYLRGENVRQVGGRGSGVDALIEAAGARDVGVEMGIEEFRPLTDEALIEAAPDVLVVTTSGLESVGGTEGLLELPAVAATPAGRDRRVVALDDQLLLGLGPRTGDALRQLVDALHPDTDPDTDTDRPTQETDP